MAKVFNRDVNCLEKVYVKGGLYFGDASSSTSFRVMDTNGTFYQNRTGSATSVVKAHDHLMTVAGSAAEIRTETVATSGSHYGLNTEAHINATGTGSVFGNFGVAKVTTGYTVTGGTIVGSYGQARADGTVAGASFMAGLYGLIEASAAITASHVCSAWLDSHQANAVTGSHQLLYMTNNGAATMDEAIYIYGGNKITALMELNTCGTMVADTATTSGASKKIAITIDGYTFYLNAYAG